MKFLFLLAVFGSLCIQAISQIPPIVRNDAPPPPPAPVKDYFPDKWQESVVSEYGFSVRTPGPLKKSIELPEVNADAARWVKFSYGSPSFLTYSVSVKILPEPVPNEAAVSKVFDDVVSMRINRAFAEGRKLDASDIQVDTFPSRIYDIESGSRRIRNQIFLRGRVVYLVQVVSAAKDSASAMMSSDGYGPIAKGFFNSFRFTAVSEGPQPVLRPDEGNDDVWSEFVGDADGFKNMWPGKPVLTTTDIKSSMRVIPQNIYSLTANLITYKMIVQTYDMTIDDKAAIENVYNSWRGGFAKAAGYHVVVDQTTSFAGIEGREMRVESDSTVLIAKAVYSQGRFYSASSSYQKMYEPMPRVKRLIDASVDKFFRSTTLVLPQSLRIAKDEDLNLPDNFFGEAADGLYRNEYFGIELKYPAAWIIASTDSNKMLLQYSRSAMAGQNPDLLNKLRSPEKVLLMMSKQALGSRANSSFTVDAIKERTSNIDLAGTVRKNEAIYGGMQNSRITVSTTKTTLDGHAAYFFEREQTLGSFVIKQRVIATLHENYTVYFFLTWIDDADLATLESIEKSIRLKK